MKSTMSAPHSYGHSCSNGHVEQDCPGGSRPARYIAGMQQDQTAKCQRLIRQPSAGGMRQHQTASRMAPESRLPCQTCSATLIQLRAFPMSPSSVSLRMSALQEADAQLPTPVPPSPRSIASVPVNACNYTVSSAAVCEDGTLPC
jgi:hypothetical protein